MKKRLADLAYRRRVLLEKIEAQQMEAAKISQHWQKSLALVDVGVKVVRFIHNHPALVAGGVAALFGIAPQGHCRTGAGGVAFVAPLSCNPFLGNSFSKRGAKYRS